MTDIYIFKTSIPLYNIPAYIFFKGFQNGTSMIVKQHILHNSCWKNTCCEKDSDFRMFTVELCDDTTGMVVYPGFSHKKIYIYIYCIHIWYLYIKLHIYIYICIYAICAWWKKTWTSWYGKSPIIYKVLYIPGPRWCRISFINSMYIYIYIHTLQ